MALVFQPLAPGQRPGWWQVHPVVVPDDPASLKGPSSGTVTLPLTLDWSPDPTYDVSRPERAASMYKTVLLEAGNEKIMGEYISWDLLRKIWGRLRLRLPKFCQEAWEERHPELKVC